MGTLNLNFNVRNNELRTYFSAIVIRSCDLDLTIEVLVAAQSQRDSNPCLHLERVMSWATRRWDLECN